MVYTIYSDMTAQKFWVGMVNLDSLCWGLTTIQPLWVVLCCLPEKRRKEIEEIVEGMKERNREERGTGMKVKNKEIKTFPLYPYLLQG